MPSRQRVTAVASMLGAGSLVASGVFLGSTPTAPDSTGLLGGVQHDLKLVNFTDALGTILIPWADPSTLPNLQQMEKFVMDALLGIGPKTLPQFMDPNGTTTLQDLFNEYGKLTSDNFTLGGTTPSTMTDVFNAMGLNNSTLTNILTLLGLSPTGTVETMLTKFGLDNLTLDDLLKGFNVSDATTISALANDLGAGSMTVGSILTGLGVPSTTTLDNLLTGLNLGTLHANQLEGFLPLLGLTPTESVWTAMAYLSGNAITSSTAVTSLLSPGTTSGTGEGLLGFIGGMSLGKAMGFTTSTSLESVLDGLKFNVSGSLSALGSLTITQLLGQVHLTPGESLASVLGSLPLGYGGATTLGSTTLANFLTVLDQGHTVNETTTVTQFFDNGGIGSQTIDTLLGLANVDISNWFIPAT